MKKIMKILVVFGFVMINSYAHCGYKERWVNVKVKFPNKTFEFKSRWNAYSMSKAKYYWDDLETYIKKGTTTELLVKRLNANNDKNVRYQVYGTLDDGNEVYISVNPKIFNAKDKKGRHYTNWKWEFDNDGNYHLWFQDFDTKEYTEKEVRNIIKK
jgi:hypothetical protein